MDARTRPLHASWPDTVPPADDPWWKTHFPPNRWNCRCTVQSLDDRDLARYGLSVSAKAPEIPWVERVITTPAGPRTVLVPEGIDPGFAYRPGAFPPIEQAAAGAPGVGRVNGGRTAPMVCRGSERGPAVKFCLET